MKKPSPPKRSWLFAAAVVAGVVGYVVFLFLPGQRATAELRRELEDKQRFVTTNANVDAQIAHVDRELNRTLEFTKAWRAEAPTEARIAQVFVQITRHSEQAHVEIVRFEPQPIARMEHLEKAPIDMACEGTFAQIHDFLGHLESLKADFWITRMHCEPVTAGLPRLRCELSLTFFADRRKNSD
jgi:Tfp pilus assembly protein PilO